MGHCVVSAVAGSCARADRCVVADAVEDLAAQGALGVSWEKRDASTWNLVTLEGDAVSLRSLGHQRVQSVSVALVGPELLAVAGPLGCQTASRMDGGPKPCAGGSLEPRLLSEGYLEFRQDNFLREVCIWEAQRRARLADLAPPKADRSSFLCSLRKHKSEGICRDG